MSKLYKTIDIICKENGISVNEMCKKMGQSSSFIYELKSGRTQDLSSKIKNKIAKLFNVSVDFLDNVNFEGNVPCPLCGGTYFSDDPKSIKEHDIYHQRWMEAVKKFGFCWGNISYRHEVSGYVDSIIDSGQADSIENLVKLYETRFKALFSRAILATNLPLDAITFEDYVAGLLANKSPTRVPDENSKEYKFLVDKYGINEGLLDGTYFAENKNSNKKNNKKVLNKTSISAISNQSVEVVSTSLTGSIILKKYNTLDEYGKKAVDSILDIEYNRCTSEPKEEEILTITIQHSLHKVSAGHGFDLNNEDEWEEIEVPDTPEARRADFSITIDGDSMEPIYSDGDIVLVKAQPTVNIGETGIFVVNGSGYIKQNGGDRLISLNPDYDDIFFSEWDTISCAGKVIGTV